jgi:8-oxo-dGTP pyrophosphatase MutT (NUDIX family)
MKLLKEIIRREGAKKVGRTIHREAVRGIIRDGRKLLMIYSPVNGDYKFPGGGVVGDEMYVETLTREVSEECGAQVIEIEAEFGSVVEYDIPTERDYDVFKMTSFYYLCRIASEFSQQRLDTYEQHLGFSPVWIDIDVAIQTNTAVLQSGRPRLPRWTRRDTFVLEQVKQQLFENDPLGGK